MGLGWGWAVVFKRMLLCCQEQNHRYKRRPATKDIQPAKAQHLPAHTRCT